MITVIHEIIAPSHTTKVKTIGKVPVSATKLPKALANKIGEADTLKALAKLQEYRQDKVRLLLENGKLLEQKFSKYAAALSDGRKHNEDLNEIESMIKKHIRALANFKA